MSERLTREREAWKANGLTTEERSAEASGLRRREARCREGFHGLICDLALLHRYRWDAACAPTVDPCADVLVEPRGSRDLVGESVEFTHLIQQGLELLLVDSHEAEQA